MIVNNEKTFGDIRVFANSEEYSGPTKKSIQLRCEELKSLKNLIADIDGKNIDKRSLKIGELDRSKTSSVVIQIKNNKYTNFNEYLDVRIHVDSNDYTGFTKKGFRFNLELIENFNEKLDILIKQIETGLEESQRNNNKEDEFKGSGDESGILSKIKEEIDKS